MVTPLKDAVTVAVPAAAVEVMLAVKLAFVAPPPTATAAGTVTPVSELTSLTLEPPGGAGPLRSTVQVEVPGAVTEAGVQEIPVRFAEAGDPP